VIDEPSNISEKEVETEEETVLIETQEPTLLQEITPTEAPPPFVEKVVIQPSPQSDKVVLNNTPEPKGPKRHPRNIPKFSFKRS
jgi:hypothetical protein